MSLILEALKKLDREKGTPDRGFLVLAHLQRPLRGKSRAWALLAAAGAAAAVAGLGAALWRGQATRPAPAEGEPRVDRAGPPATAAPVTPAAAPSARPAWTMPPRTAVGPSRSAGVPSRSEDLSPAPVEPRKPAPSVSAASPAPDLRLNAISQQDGRPVAILNDRLVREGDSFDGIRVLRIGEAEVEVEVGGVRRVIGF